MRTALALVLALIVLTGCNTAQPPATGTADDGWGPLPPGAGALVDAADLPGPDTGETPAQPAPGPARPDAAGPDSAGSGTPGPGSAPAPGSAPGPGSGAPPAPGPGPVPAGAPPDHPGVLAGPPERCYAGSAVEPAPPYMAVYLSADSIVYSHPEYYILDPACRVVVGAATAAVEVVAPEGTDPGLLRAAVQATAGGPVPAHLWSVAGRTVQIRFPDPAVREMSVSVAGPLQPDGRPVALGVSLVRDYPEVIAELRQGGGDWEWLDPLKTYPDLPTELRLRFNRPVDPSWLPDQFQTSTPGVEWHWTDAMTFTVALSDPPPLFVVDPSGATDARGMWAEAAPAVLHTGQSPAVMAFDPATGQAEVVAPAPPEAYDALLSPDGRWLAVKVWLPAAGAWDGWQETVVVVDLEQGNMHVTPLSGWAGWGAAGELVGSEFGDTVRVWNCRTRTERRLLLTGDLWQAAVSPDGALLAAYDLLWDQEDGSYLLPAELVVVNLRTGAEQRYPEWTRYYAMHSEFGVPFPVVWDGSGAVIGLDYTGPEDWDWVRLDLATGRREAMNPEQAEGLTLTGLANAPGGWVYLDHSWDPVTAPLPDGGTADLGPGLAAGRAPDRRFLFIRWPGHADRYMAAF